MLDFNRDLLAQIESGDLEKLSADELIRWGFDNLGPRVALLASFGGSEGMVLLDLMHRVSRDQTRVITIDTGRLPQETHDLMELVRDRYDLEIEVYFPQMERVESMVRRHGPNLFYESPQNRELCCGIRKVEPLRRALGGLEGWFSGLRKEQSTARRSVRAAEIDQLNGGLVKLNPLAHWSRARVDRYVREHAISVNALQAEGYPSVGCAPCSRAIEPGEDERAGRWWWESAPERECGIHFGYKKTG